MSTFSMAFAKQFLIFSDLINPWYVCSSGKKGYTKNQAIKKMPMPSSTTVRCGNTAGFMGLT